MTTTDLQTPTARKRLAPRSKPHKTAIGRGLTLGYYRPQKGPGSWQAIVAIGAGKQWTKAFGQADDLGASPEALSYSQALTKAIELAQGRAPSVAVAAPPVTIEQAIANYKTDLQSRSGNLTNATQILYHIPPTHPLRSALLSQVTINDLNEWRLALVRNNMQPATLKRLFKSIHAAFNRAAKMDPRVAANANAWKEGLTAPRDADRARNAVHPLPDIRALVAAAYDLDPAFGLFVHVHAELGARSDQIARIRIAHLHGDRIQVPNSGKGRGKNKNTSGTTVRALAPDLANRLAKATLNRPRSAPLLTQTDGSSWADNDRARRLFDRAVANAGVKPVDEDNVTLITFRHSAIVHRILANVPLKIVATMHNTSTAKIESNYAVFLPTDDFDRATLVATGPADVVPLAAAA